MSSDETQDAFGSFGARFDPATVSVVGPYHDVRYFAAGGMAWVYEARHPQFPEKRLAVKLMKPEFAAMPMMRDRFLREAQLLARIGHPHLVTVHSFGVDEASHCPYFAMDYIDGGNLAEKLEADGPLSVEAAGELYDRVLGALAALHQQGVIHRDIKPLNIFLWRSGEPMLADLGIARDTAAGGAATTQHYIGSPKYSSPEQANGLRIDVRSDIFSLGLSLFETLVGYHPYEDAKNVDTSSAASLIGLLALLYRDKKPIPLEFPREIPKALRAVIRKACEIQPDKRFADADEMRRALRIASRAGGDGRGESALAGQITSLRIWLATNGRQVGLGVGALAMLAALAVGGYEGWGWYQRAQAEKAVRRAAQAVTAIAPDDRDLAKRLSLAGEEIERDRPATAIEQAEAVCSELAQRLGTSLGQAVPDAGGALRRAKFAVQHAAGGAAAWEELDGLVRNEAARTPRLGNEAACDAPIRLDGYSRKLGDAARALGAALDSPDLKGRVVALRDRAHGAALAPSIDAKLLSEADQRLAAGDLPEALELYTQAELGARAGELSKRYAAQLREVAAAPEFAERRSQVSSALARVVKLGSLSDLDALAAELDPAASDAKAALDAVNADVTAALTASDQALARARDGGVSKERLASGEAQLVSARGDLQEERFVAALGSAKASATEFDRLLKVLTEGGVAAKGAIAAASAKRADAVAAGAGERTLAKGDALMAKAGKLVEDGNPAEAANQYASAEAEFTAAQSAAIATAKKLAGVVRERAASEKKRAGELGASSADLGPGDQAEQLGEQAFASGDFNTSQKRFAEARDAYQRAPLRAAGERAAQAREAALAAGVPESALADGDAALKEARAPELDADEALKGLAAAEAAFARARSEAIALADKAKAAALQAQSEAQAARRKAQDAKLADAELADGDRELGLGDGALAKGELDPAKQHFAAASSAYRSAPLRGADASAARAREQALGSGARESALAKGDAALQKARDAKRPEDALKQYGLAEAAFARAGSDAVALTGSLKATALQAQSDAQAARQTARDAGAGDAALADAERELGLGDQSLQGGDFDAARQHFAAARGVYQNALLQGAQDRAARAREDALSAGAKPAALAKGDAALKKARSAKPADAPRLYEAAEASFAAARAEALASTDKAKADPHLLEEAQGQRRLAASAQGAAVRAQATKTDLAAGRAALEEGDAALAKGDTATASERFGAAKALFEEAAKAARARAGQ